MKRNWKRFMAWLLIATMVLGSNTVTAFAEELSDGFTSEDIIFEEPIESSYVDPVVEEIDEIFISSDDFSSVEIIEDNDTIEEASVEYFTDEPTEEPTVAPTVEPPVAPTEEPTVEPTVVPTVEPTIAPTEEPTEIPPETPAPIFEQGYVRVSGGASVYKAVNGEEAGRFLNDAYVYGIVEHRAEEIDNDWLKITFDTAYNRENGIALYEGFVKGNRAKVLTQEDADDLYNRTAYETGVRSYRNFYLPATQYEEYATKQAEDVIEEEPPVEEELEEPAFDPGYEDAQKAAPFENGYVRISVGTTVYSSASKDDELGTVDADAVVYVSEVIRDDEGNIIWMRVVFDTTDEKTVDGYAVGASATILDGENEVSIVSFTFKEAETLERKNVTVSADTTIYAQANTEDVLGTIIETATVYILEVVENGSDVWMKVSFASESGETIEGYILYVPPRWAHRTINTGSAPMVSFFTFRSDAGHDYGTIELKGYRKLVVERDGKPVMIDNPRWAE